MEKPTKDFNQITAYHNSEFGTYASIPAGYDLTRLFSKVDVTKGSQYSQIYYGYFVSVNKGQNNPIDFYGQC